MHVAIMGAGGLGAYYGGMLARAGEPVHFIARRAQLAALRKGGLRVQSAHVGDFHLPRVNATDDPAGIGPVDCVLMGVKAYDLAHASEAIRPLLGPDTFVVPLLNGVDMAERIGAVVGTERVLGGVTFLSSNVLEPGLVRHVLDGPLIFGELNGAPSARADSLQAALRGAGAAAEHTREIRLALWRKFVMVSSLAGVCSVLRQPTRRMMADPQARQLFTDAMREVEALARASGAALEADLIARHLAFADGVSGQHTVSMLLDLRAGRRLELDAMTGTVVRLGEERGVSTPIHRVLYAALKLYEDGEPG